jgi:hypothetical protein
MSVGPIGLILLWPFYLLWLGAVGLYSFFVFVARFVVFLLPLVWSVAVLVYALVGLGWAHLRARTRRPASD